MSGTLQEHFQAWVSCKIKNSFKNYSLGVFCHEFLFLEITNLSPWNIIRNSKEGGGRRLRKKFFKTKLVINPFCSFWQQKGISPYNYQYLLRQRGDEESKKEKEKY